MQLSAFEWGLTPLFFDLEIREIALAIVGAMVREEENIKRNEISRKANDVVLATLISSNIARSFSKKPPLKVEDVYPNGILVNEKSREEKNRDMLLIERKNRLYKRLKGK